MRLLCALIVGTMLAGCNNGTSVGSEPTRSASTADMSKVDKAAAIANAIKAEPDRSDEILRQNGLTEQQFQDLMYEIAADPAMSERYNAKVR